MFVESFAGAVNLTAAAAQGAGAGLPCLGCRTFGLQVVLGSGAPATAVVKLQGTIDGTHWFTLTTWDVTAPLTSGDIVFAVDKPVAQVRANCTTLDTGANKTVTATISAA